ncbi:MAG: 2-keto-4-pentenoate hydratase, partial [Burkholderiaceae bacterium]
MPDIPATPDMPALPLRADILLDACDHARALDRSRYLPLTDLAQGESLQAGIAVARLARGERPVGYKIGFTNRRLWPLYGVFHPIWGPVWDTTLTRVEGGEAEIAIDRFVEPRLEPEIVIGLRETPAAATPEAVLAATAWIAHGVEIVQCPFPGWRFSAAEAFAAQSLHGALLIGAPRPLPKLKLGGDPATVLARLAGVELSLYCDGTLVERGRGANALDGPMHAIAHLAHELSLRGQSIAPGSLITTGTLTDAQPLRSGQCWTTQLENIDLPGLGLR